MNLFKNTGSKLAKVASNRAFDAFPSRSLAVTAIGSVLSLGAGQAFAQFNTQNQVLGQPDQIEDVLTFQAGLDINQHDNIFLLRDGANPPAIYGDSKRGDTLLTALFGVKFDRDVSLQRFTASGAIRPVKFINYSQFDYVGYDLAGNWDWAIGRPWFGKLGFTLGQTASSFSDVVNINDTNLQETTRLYLTGGLRLTPSWALIAGIDRVQLDNSISSLQPSNYTFTGYEFGGRFAPGTGTEVDLVFRRTDGEYPNRQVTDSLGNLLGSAIDNAFTQDELLLRASYRPNEDALVSGQVGYTKRSFDNLSQRDFSGPTARIAYDWRPGGRFFMGAELLRDIYSEEVLTASYVDTRRILLRPSFRLTGKISLNGTFSFSQLNYEGDPGFVANNTAVRKDKLNMLGVRLDWQYSRNVLFNLEYRTIERISNFANAEYTNNIIGIGAKLNF